MNIQSKRFQGIVADRKIARLVSAAIIAGKFKETICIKGEDLTITIKRAK